MPQGEIEGDVSPIGARLNETRWPTCEAPVPISTELTSPPKVVDGATFGGQCACGVVLLALYIVLCNYWPEIPTAFLALVTAVGLSGFLDKKPVATVSSQTSSTNQATYTQTEGQTCPWSSHLHYKTNQESVHEERRLSLKVTHKEHQLFPQPGETEHETNDLGQREHQSLSELTHREGHTNDLHVGQREHLSCLELAHRERQTNDLGQRHRHSCSELAHRERQTNELGQREYQSYSELTQRDHQTNDLGHRLRLLCSELNQRERQTDDLGHHHLQSSSELAKREHQRAEENHRDHLLNVRSELAQTDRQTNYLCQRDSQSCSELDHGEFRTQLSHSETRTNSVDLRLSEFKMGSGLIQTESEANVEHTDAEYHGGEFATPNVYPSQYCGGTTLSQGVQTDEDETTNINGIFQRTVRQPFVKTRDFSGSTTDDNEWPDLSDAETNVEDSNLEADLATAKPAGDTSPGVQVKEHVSQAVDGAPKGGERHASVLKKQSPNFKHIKTQNGQQSLSATKAKRSPRVAPRVRVASSETVTSRLEIPAFGKVWREPEERVRQVDVSHAGNFQQNKSPEDGHIAEDVTREPGKPSAYNEPSNDCSSIVTGNSMDQNLNCHNCSMYGHASSDCLREPISSRSEQKGKSQNADSSALQSRNKPSIDFNGVHGEHAQAPDSGVSQVPSVVDGGVSPATPPTGEAHTQTVLFSDILRINIRRQLQTETRRFHTRRSRLRLRYARELEKLRRELVGKNQILSSLQLKIPTLEQEIHGLRMEKAEIIRALQEERGKTLTLMGRLKDVYDRLMVINSAQLLQQQHLQFDHSM